MIPFFMSQATRIINGERAVGPIPWQVFWSYPSTPRCGGTILDRRTILSAAHCVDIFSQHQGITVKAGGINRNSPQQIVGVERIVYNSDLPYSEKTLENDIILLKLSQPLEFNYFVQPACLPPSPRFIPPDTRCLVSGWGTIDIRNPKYENDLQWADVYITRQDTCRDQYAKSSASYQITDGMICAHNLKEKDACQGDSGGPLICGQNGLPVITGIVSFGEGCANPSFPGVYTRVSHYLNWIKRNLEPQYLQRTYPQQIPTCGN